QACCVGPQDVPVEVRSRSPVRLPVLEWQLVSRREHEPASRVCPATRLACPEFAAAPFAQPSSSLDNSGRQRSAPAAEAAAAAHAPVPAHAQSQTLIAVPDRPRGGSDREKTDPKVASQAAVRRQAVDTMKLICSGIR